MDGDFFLDDDRASIDFGNGDVNHTAAVGDFARLVGGEGAFDGVDAVEGAREGGVEVDDLVAEGGEEAGAEDMHPASEDDEVWFVFSDFGGEVGVILLTAFARFFIGEEGKVESGDVGVLGAGETVCLALVRDDSDDIGVDFACLLGIDDGLEVGAAARNKDNDTWFGHGNYLLFI